ncbi:MAG TPA: ribonuclease catalytic domain-containing protein, partial [Candidatus Acidoferrales bacterium]|nr:ribonuclease catalytic domain-containing protein [Candidatus Acidoferrales bacterium]
MRNQLRTIARQAMIDRGLRPDFPKAALTEIAKMNSPAAADGSTVRDLRKLPWVSIDNDDSRDLDQLSVATPGSNGATKILVAIADVDALVKPGSAVDQHAEANTTSVYTAGGIFSMLPEKLSTNLTSLNDGEQRLAIVVEFAVDGNGAIGASDVYRAQVLNHAKLAYNSVAAWLDGSAPAPKALATAPELQQQLRLQDQIAQLLKGRRHQQGALTLQTIEARAVFDGDVLSDLQPDEKNRAKELIEDFMIAANGVTARYLATKRLPSLRRVLRSPERWGRIVELAQRLGEELPPEPDARILEEFLCKRRAADPQRFPDLSLTVIKL